jgi:hypothetical protein
MINLSKRTAIFFIISGIVLLVVSLCFAFVSDAFLLKKLMQAAGSHDASGRLSGVTQERLNSEFLFVIKRLKSVLPVIALSMIAWGALWLSVMFKKVDFARQIDEEPVCRRAWEPPVLFCVAAAAAALAIRLVNFNQSLWYDEIHAYQNAIGEGFIRIMTYKNQILHSMFSRISTLVFGPWEWALRLPAVVFGLCSFFAMPKLASFISQRRVVLLSMALLIFSPLHIDQSQQARGYAMLMLFSILSCYCFLISIHVKSGVYGIGYIISCVAGLNMYAD